jgi:hypothetical protein
MSRLRYFTVRGSGNFPFNLLSRDECFPANTAEAERISLACPTVAPEQSITLATARGTFTPTAWKEARWPVIAAE